MPSGRNPMSSGSSCGNPISRSPICRSPICRSLCRDCYSVARAASGVCRACASTRIVTHDEIGDLTIAHIDCDAFYAMVEKRDNPDLRGKPVIVGHPGGRGVVTTACYVARKFGPRSAMPMFKALKLCPDAIVIQPNMAKYKAVSGEIREIFSSVSDCIEPVSLDEAYLDLSDAHRLSAREPAAALAEAARRIEREVRISVSIGLSYAKSLAKLASELQKPRGFSVIGRAEAKAFLASLPVGKIHGIGAATAERMAALGFTTVADLQAADPRELIGRFGRFGERLVMLINGCDDRAVTPDRETKSISAENTFSVNISSPDALIAEVRPMCDRVSERLKRNELAGNTVVLKLKTGNFQTITRNVRLAHPTQRADVLFQQAGRLIAREADGRAFRLIGIGVADLVPAAAADPPDLFSRG
jgi:DNA polymerase IV